EWVAELTKANDAFVSLTGAYDAVVEKNKELKISTGVTTDAYIGELRKQVEAQQAWQNNMVELSERVNRGMSGDMREAANAMIDELAKLGPEGAEELELLHSMSDAELREVVELYGIRGGEAGGMYGSELARRLEETKPKPIGIHV